MDEAELDRLETLMAEEDPHLLKWVMGQEVPPENVDIALLDRVIAEHKARVSK
jgi:antitoxin CptB